MSRVRTDILRARNRHAYAKEYTRAMDCRPVPGDLTPDAIEQQMAAYLQRIRRRPHQAETYVVNEADRTFACPYLRQLPSFLST